MPLPLHTRSAVTARCLLAHDVHLSPLTAVQAPPTLAPGASHEQMQAFMRSLLAMAQSTNGEPPAFAPRPSGQPVPPPRPPQQPPPPQHRLGRSRPALSLAVGMDSTTEEELRLAGDMDWGMDRDGFGRYTFLALAACATQE